MKNIFSYLLFLLFINIIKVLPYSLCKKLATGLGILLYNLLKGRNKIIRNNLSKAFPGEYTEEEREELIKKIYRNLGMTFIEFMLLEKLTNDEINSYISVEGKENLDNIKKDGKGVILYTAHFGNWEWQGAHFSIKDYPVVAIARDQNNPFFNKRINKIRRSKNVEMIPRDGALRKIIKSLHKGKYLYILGDQNARRRGWQIDFFGRKASTYTGPVRLASSTGAYILPVFMAREDWMKHKIFIYPPYQIEKGSSKKEQQEDLQYLTELTEKVISKYPDQWFWLHRRWKM